jgi:hypothetical protein
MMIARPLRAKGDEVLSPNTVLQCIPIYTPANANGAKPVVVAN